MKQTDPQYKLRLPVELKNAIEIASEASNQTMNAEIVARLQRSFEHRISDLSFFAKEAVKQEMARASCSEQEAIERLLISANANATGKLAVFLNLSTGMTLTDLTEIFKAAGELLPKDSVVLLQPKG